MYKLLKFPDGTLQNCILRLSDGAFIFKSDNNPHYQEYLKWLEEGNTPEPAEQDE
jgi:hypothetical protein